MAAYKEHGEIWLEPVCPKCGEDSLDRQWCSDDVWAGDICDVCGEELASAKYLLATAKPEPEDGG